MKFWGVGGVSWRRREGGERGGKVGGCDICEFFCGFEVVDGWEVWDDLEKGGGGGGRRGCWRFRGSGSQASPTTTNHMGVPQSTACEHDAACERWRHWRREPWKGTRYAPVEEKSFLLHMFQWRRSVDKGLCHFTPGTKLPVEHSATQTPCGSSLSPQSQVHRTRRAYIFLPCCRCSRFIHNSSARGASILRLARSGLAVARQAAAHVVSCDTAESSSLTSLIHGQELADSLKPQLVHDDRPIADPCLGWDSTTDHPGRSAARSSFLDQSGSPTANDR